MAGDITDYWFNSIGVEQDYKTMVYFAGDGGDTFEINFEGGYINKAHVKAYMIHPDQTHINLTLTFLTESRVKTNVPVPAGFTVLIYRDTPKATPLAEFVDGAIINALNLDRNAKQAIFCVAEMVDRFDNVNANSEEALRQVYLAITTSQDALAKAIVAESNSTLAKELASAADTASKAAVSTANAAKGTADAAYTVATGIEGKADAAVTTANAANKTALGIDAKATAALAASNSAVSTAASANSSASAAVTTANEAKATAEGVDSKATQALASTLRLEGSKVDRKGDTLTGPLILARDGILPKEAVTRSQLDGRVSYTDPAVRLPGAITAAGDIKSTLGDLYSGDARIAHDGNIFGTVWGDSLFAYIDRKTPKAVTLYPNGTPNAPAVIGANQMQGVSNPFPGRLIAARAEVLYNGIWGEAGWDGNTGSGSSALGLRATTRHDYIVVVSGSIGVLGQGQIVGNAMGVTTGYVVSVPYRVVVWTID